MSAVEVSMLSTISQKPDDHRIQITSNDGTLIRQWDNAGGGNGRLFLPHDAQVGDDGNLFVTDSGNSRIVEMRANGEFVRQIGSRGVGQGEFVDPGAMVSDGHGGLLVADRALSRVQDLSMDGAVRAVWGSAGTGDGQFGWLSPSGLAVGPDGTIYAVDLDGNRVEHFTADGHFLGWAGRCDGGSNCDVAHAHSKGFRCTASSCTGLGSGSDPGQFSNPYDLTFDRSGRLLVTDYGNGRVEVYNLTNDGLETWPIPPLQSGQSSYTAAGIAVDGAGHVYVTSVRWDNDTLAILDGSGHMLGRWGSSGGGITQFYIATRVRVSNDRVIVTDTGNHRISRFHLFSQGDENQGGTDVVRPNTAPSPSTPGFSSPTSGNSCAANWPASTALCPLWSGWK